MKVPRVYSILSLLSMGGAFTDSQNFLARPGNNITNIVTTLIDMRFDRNGNCWASSDKANGAGEMNNMSRLERGPRRTDALGYRREMSDEDVYKRVSRSVCSLLDFGKCAALAPRSSLTFRLRYRERQTRRWSRCGVVRIIDSIFSLP